MVDRVVAERMGEIEHHMVVLLDDAEFLHSEAQAKEVAWKRRSSNGGATPSSATGGAGPSTPGGTVVLETPPRGIHHGGKERSATTSE